MLGSVPLISLVQGSPENNAKKKKKDYSKTQRGDNFRKAIEMNKTTVRIS